MEQGSKQPKIAIIASEPLSSDRYQWLPIPSNSLVIASKREAQGDIENILILPINKLLHDHHHDSNKKIYENN